MTSGNPVICLVDDQPDKAEATLRGGIERSVVILPRSPSELELSDLETADIILVDFELRARWSRPDGIPIARHPPDGLALAAVIRAHVADAEVNRPRAIALYSAELQKVGEQLPSEVRGHALARLHDLEWVFEKMDADAGRKIVALGWAVHELHAEWPDTAAEAERELHRLLAVPDDAEWSAQAAHEIEDCHPPIHELSELSQTLALLRWLAQRVLPYPCFLADRLYAAARLRLTPEAFDLVAESDSPYAKDLGEVRYQGILSEFLGPRWWRTGLDTCLWRWTGGTLSSRELRATLAKDHLDVPESVPEPVVVINDSYQPHAIVDVGQAVRVQPDDWPPFAELAWVRIEDALASPRLRGLVVRDDRPRLSTAAPTQQ